MSLSIAKVYMDKIHGILSGASISVLKLQVYLKKVYPPSSIPFLKNTPPCFYSLYDMHV